NGAVNGARIRAGDLVWRTDDPDIAKLARPYTAANSPVAKQAVDVRVVAREGAALEITWSVGGVHVTVRSAEVLGAAQNRALGVELLRDQLGRLGNTPYLLREVDAVIEGSPFVAASVLNQLRRDAVELLQEMQGRVVEREMHSPSLRVSDRAEMRAVEPQLHLLVRNAAQLDAALGAKPASITLDYLDLYGLLPSLEKVRAAGIEARVASPRVLKPGEEKIAEFLRRCGVPILVRPAGLLETLHGWVMDGDFSLNAANAMSAEMLFELGLRRLAPTHDLNAAQITELARRVGAGRMEAIAYHHLPVFHTEHCVFCRFLSTGTSYKDCGRPCEKHQLALRDTAGRAHAVIADIGCRNTVFGAEAQEASAHLDDWLAAGVRHFRLEFVHESAERVAGIAGAFAERLAGRMTSQELGRRLKRLAPEGTTEGSLQVPFGSELLRVLQ
ncbi:MAG: DUF3656 domain-containing protein, partial [Acidobacteriota bacterium]